MHVHWLLLKDKLFIDDVQLCQKIIIFSQIYPQNKGVHWTIYLYQNLACIRDDALKSRVVERVSVHTFL